MRLFFLILSILVACSKQAPTDAQLKLSFYIHPHTIDPRLATDFPSSTLVCMLYEGLTRSLPGGAVEPALAQRVEISKDKKRYLFHLREAYWSNGEQISAYDFERSWKEIIFPAHSCAFLFYPIKNAEKASRGEVDIDEVGISALGPLTLCVDLEAPTPYFYPLTAFPSFLPAPKQSNVYSGPFELEKMALNSEILLRKNETFWNKKCIHLDSIHISIIPDETTALQMFERGELDWIGGPLSPIPLDAIEKNREQIQYLSTPGSTFCTFNTKELPFSNRNLRKAFSLAIDRKELGQHISQANQVPAESILPPPFSTQSLNLTDLSDALFYFQKGLEELGIKPQDLEHTPLYCRSNQIEKKLAQIVQKQWQKVFEITIPIVQLDFKSHAQKLQTKDYQIALASWIAQFDDPVSLLDRFKYADHRKNYPGWESAEYLACLSKASKSEKRQIWLALAETILADEMPITPLYHWSLPILVNQRVEKIAISACGGILFERFELAKNL